MQKANYNFDSDDITQLARSIYYVHSTLIAHGLVFMDIARRISMRNLGESGAIDESLNPNHGKMGRMLSVGFYGF